MCENEDDIITVGKYVIIKKLSFKKIYKVTMNGTLMLGKDTVQMHEIIGKPFWTTFEMVQVKGGKRTYSLKEVVETESLNDLLSELPSGSDNRSIIDDGTSQKLSKEQILQLQESGKSGKEIVGSLIENNKSFLERTEYSQEKYLKKKEQKYLKYITIWKPSINLLHDIYFKQDHKKIGNLRMDSLAQLLSYSDVQSDGLYILYDSGSHGLPAAAMLNRIGSNTMGHLINLHPGNKPQVTLINAMNFPKEQSDRLLNVNIYSFLRLYYQGASAVLDQISKKAYHDNINNVKNVKSKNDENHVNKQLPQVEEKIGMKEETLDNNELNDEIKHSIGMKEKNLDDNESNDEIKHSIDEEEKNLDNDESNDKTKHSTDMKETNSDIVNELNEDVKHSTNGNLKRKLNESDKCNSAKLTPVKKPKWLSKTQEAVDLVNGSKARGLAIIAREHPLNIIMALLPFLGPSRPFVIYHVHREPLLETYMTLKHKQNVINLKLFSNFLRSYQVLPDRTHPDILTSDTGGYLLSGYLVQ